MKAMIIRPGALGDTLMLMPALVDLRGKADATFVGRQPGLQFVGPHVRRVVDMEGAGWHRLFSDPPSREGLPVEKPDLVAAFFRDESGNIERNLRTYFPDVPVRVFPSYPEPESVAHEAHYLASRLASAGLPVDPETAMKRAEEGPLLEAARASTAEPYVVLHPGSGSVKKNMPPEFWLELIRTAKGEPEKGWRNVRVLLGPAEEGVCRRFEGDGLEKGVSTIVSPPGRSVLSLLGNASLYVGHDSGITHLAAMSGAPTVAIFKTTDANRWRPIGPRATVLESGTGAPELLPRILDAARRLLDGRR